MKKIKLIFLIFVITLLCGCSDGNSNESLEEKTIAEMEYINTKSVNILNNLNNISLKNYKIVSEKVSLTQETQSAESGAENQSSSQSESSSGSQSTNQNSDKNQGSSEGQGSEITVTDMMADTILANDKDDIDWDAIKTDIELINSAWSVIVLDLYSQGVSNDIISGFEDTLNQCLINIKEENKDESLINVAKLYSYIPQFLSASGADTNTQKIKQTQSYILNAYSLVKDDLSNQDIATNIENAKNEFEEIMNDTEFIKDKTYKTNKTYVLINELKNSVESNDADVFFLKYKLLMESINTL